ncbi:MAG: hypothetical protein KKA42_13550, partial [candidate division Zixibacteria bacterium]|nr:hypothetical protein [candidate division Zixibacteria bacterium]
LAVMIFGMLLFFVVIGLRLGQLQIVHASSYSEMVEKQSTGKVPIPAGRGMIYDRHGQLVAKNVTRASLYAYPETRAELKSVARYVEKLFGMKAGTAIKKYGLAPDRFRWIKRHLDDELAARVTADSPAGLHLRDETVREYPFGRIGKQILGFTNIDGDGLAGVELSWDSLLAGQKGWADIRRDGLRRTYRVRETALVKPVPGQSLVLTIDWRLQAVVEEELAAALEAYNAKSGMAAFIDCNSGDILAMAHVDPDERNPGRPVKLCAISDQFEPGSSFKPFTAAGLMDQGIISYADSVYCEEGYWKMERGRLRDDKKHGWMNFRSIIELSSNIGLGKWTIRGDAKKLLQTYRDFGFGTKPGCGLPGETSGSLTAPRVWSDYNVSAMAMGHSVATSALQMAMAMGTIANGGELLQANLIRGYVENTGYVKETAFRQVIHRAMTTASVDSLKSFLRGVVERGTGEPVNSPFVSIAGKTGTAEIPNLEQGGYFKNRFNASFCGYFPAESPVVAGIVVLRDPRPVTYGGHTSGKTFRRIAERYSLTNPDVFSRPDRMVFEHTRRLDITIQAPDLVGRSIRQAQMIADQEGVKLRTAVAEGTVAWQFPPPDRQMLTGDEMLVGVIPHGENNLSMIDLCGLPLRRAAAFLTRAGIHFEVEGSGTIRWQSIKAGQVLSQGGRCVLRCKPS